MSALFSTSAVSAAAAAVGLSSLGRKLHLMVAVLCAASSLLVTAPAAAALVQNNFASGSLNFTLNRPGQSGQSTSAGGFTGMLDGSAFLSYCIQLTQQFQFGTSYSNYAIVPVASAPDGGVMGVAKANDLARLVAAYFTDSFTSTVKSAAMQIAIWEIVYESSGTYDIGSGVFNVNAGNASVNNARTLADKWLDDLPGLTATAPMIALSSPNRQDFITVVPVPSSMALFAGGMLFGFWRLRRHRKA